MCVEVRSSVWPAVYCVVRSERKLSFSDTSSITPQSVAHVVYNTAHYNAAMVLLAYRGPIILFWAFLKCSLRSSQEVWGGSSSVRRDLAWEPEGRRFKSSTDRSMERGLVAGEVPVHLLGAAELPLSKAPNP